MDSDVIVSLVRGGTLLALMIGSPILLAGVVVGIFVGLVQTVTQVQDQTVAFVVKISSMIVVFAMCLPWIIEKFVDYARALFENIPETTIAFF